MIIAVDIDGVLAVERDDYHWMKSVPIRENIEKVAQLRRQGHTILIFTSRPEVDRQITATWLVQVGVFFNELIMDKPKYDLFIDDHARSEF